MSCNAIYSVIENVSAIVSLLFSSYLCWSQEITFSNTRECSDVWCQAKKKKDIQHEHTHTLTHKPGFWPPFTTTCINPGEFFSWCWNDQGWRQLSDSGLGGECWWGWWGGVDNHAWEKKGQSGGWREAPLGFFFFPNSVPINRTDVHLCNKLQTHLALGAIESPQCVRISHSWDH